MPDVLTIDRVTKRYGRGAPVIEALSYTAPPGSATGLVGPNGSGKTTFLRLLSVLSFPTEGQIRYGEIDIHARPYAYLDRVGVVHDEAELPAYLSAVELLTWILRARGRWGKEGPARVDGLLDELLLDERRHELIGTYSSGMLKKTQIAAAFVAEPDVVLLDEPFRGLDEASIEALVNLLEAHRRRGGLLFLSSHLRQPLDLLCDALLPFGG